LASFRKFFRFFSGVAGVDIDGDHREIRSAEPGLQVFSSAGHLLGGRGHAPGGPQVHQNGASAPVGELFWDLPSASSKARSGSRNGRGLPWPAPPLSPCASGASLRARSTAPRAGRDRRAVPRFSPANPVIPPQNPIAAPISTAPMGDGNPAHGSRGGARVVQAYRLSSCIRYGYAEPGSRWG